MRNWYFPFLSHQTTRAPTIHSNAGTIGVYLRSLSAMATSTAGSMTARMRNPTARHQVPNKFSHPRRMLKLSVQRTFWTIFYLHWMNCAVLVCRLFQKLYFICNIQQLGSPVIFPAISWGDSPPPPPESQIPPRKTPKIQKTLKNASNSPPPPQICVSPEPGV